MKFKPEKSVDFIFCSKRSTILQIDPIYDLFMQGTPIPRKQCHKHLGCLLDDKLTFNQHSRELVNKIHKLINPIKTLSKSLNATHLETLYNAFVLPHFDYCDILYTAANAGILVQLDQLQYQAALSITGAIKGSNKDKVFHSLGWHPLSLRRKLHMSIYTFKVLNSFGNVSNKKLFDMYYRHNPRPGLRPSLNYVIPHTYSQAFRKSTILSCITIWNTLPDDLKMCQSISLFKTKFRQTFMCSNPFPLNKVPNIARITEIYFHRLRSGLLFNADKFRHNFRDVIPDCLCGRSQTDVHVFLNCPVNNNLRQQLFNILNSIPDISNLLNELASQKQILDFLIFGSTNLCVNDNLFVLQSSSTFLHKSLDLYFHVDHVSE